MLLCWLLSCGESHSLVWLVWLQGICSFAPSNCTANHLNTHRASSLCLPYHTVLPTVSAHTLLPLICTTNRPEHTHSFSLFASVHFCIYLLLRCHMLDFKFYPSVSYSLSPFLSNIDPYFLDVSLSFTFLMTLLWLSALLPSLVPPNTHLHRLH